MFSYGKIVGLVVVLIQIIVKITIYIKKQKFTKQHSQFIRLYNIRSPECYLIRSMNYLVLPLINVPLRPQNPKHQPILLEGLKRLSQFDQLALCKTEITSEFTAAGCGELHLDICLNGLEKDFAKIQIIRYVSMLFNKETVLATSKVEFMAKSPNKHFRIYAYAELLYQGLQTAIEKDQVTHMDDTEVRAQIQFEQFKWDKEEALKYELLVLKIQVQIFWWIKHILIKEQIK
ncbi:unnamed protein product [Paramecium pentaurelia]|uniref:Elongation factor 2 n=1 Tax=Paramecium pentaurelia TaxID=43138 RepID=A0A8S1VEQ1_9CILI|nr:unnamed protein product [Paramecium pentaurelia]